MIDLRMVSLLAVVAASVAGCGTNSGTAKVNGSVSTLPFTANDAVSTVVTNSKGQSAIILISEAVNVCSKLDKGMISRMAQRLEFQLNSVDPNDPLKQFHVPTAPGTFTFDLNSSEPFASAVYTLPSSDCAVASRADGQSGQVVLTRVNDGSFAGTFDITLTTGDHISGSFDTASCRSVSTEFDNPQSLSCGS